MACAGSRKHVRAPQQVGVLEWSYETPARGIDVDLDLPPMLLVELLCMKGIPHQAAHGMYAVNSLVRLGGKAIFPAMQALA